MEESREEIDLLLRPDGPDRQVPVANGAPTGIPDESPAVDSPGA